MIAVQVDLNEVNHAKLVSIPTVAKYEDARGMFLEAVANENEKMQEGIIKQELRTTEQRVFLRTIAVNTPDRESSDKGTDAQAAAPAATAEAPPPPPAVNALTVIQKMITSFSETETMTPPPILVHTHSRAEHELLRSQTLSFLVSQLKGLALTDGPTSARRHVPILLKMSKLAELLSENAKNGKKQNSTDTLHAFFEAEFPLATADALKQAMELRALVIVADVTEEPDMLALKDAIFDELLTYRLLIIAPASLLEKAEADKELPSTFFGRCTTLEVESIGLFLNDANISGNMSTHIFQRMASTSTADPSTSHYARVSALHICAAKMDKLAIEDLTRVLTGPTCLLHTLDISHTTIGGAKLVAALKRNSSLTSLDVRCIPSMAESFEALGDMLLLADSQSRVAYLRCDTLEVLEGETSLNLRERRLNQGTMRLLTGVLKNNNNIQELDLSATGLQASWTEALVGLLRVNATLRSIHFEYNPHLDASSQASLLAIVEECRVDVTLNF